jgi:hypothetical protein
MPGIWVSNADELARARSLIDDYQRQRRVRKRHEYENALQSGVTPTLAQRLRAHPVQVIGIVLFCVFILFVSIHPFLQLIGYSQE